MTNAARKLEEAKRRWGSAEVLEGDDRTPPPRAAAMTRRAMQRAAMARESAARTEWVERQVAGL